MGAGRLHPGRLRPAPPGRQPPRAAAAPGAGAHVRAFPCRRSTGTRHAGPREESVRGAPAGGPCRSRRCPRQLRPSAAAHDQGSFDQDARRACRPCSALSLAGAEPSSQPTASAPPSHPRRVQPGAPAPTMSPTTDAPAGAEDYKPTAILLTGGAGERRSWRRCLHARQSSAPGSARGARGAGRDGPGPSPPTPRPAPRRLHRQPCGYPPDQEPSRRQGRGVRLHGVLRLPEQPLIRQGPAQLQGAAACAREPRRRGPPVLPGICGSWPPTDRPPPPRSSSRATSSARTCCASCWRRSTSTR
jgi:hypothetical protein